MKLRMSKIFTIMFSKRKENMERACPNGSMSPYLTTGCVCTVRQGNDYTTLN